MNSEVEGLVIVFGALVTIGVIGVWIYGLYALSQILYGVKDIVIMLEYRNNRERQRDISVDTQ